MGRMGKSMAAGGLALALLGAACANSASDGNAGAGGGASSSAATGSSGAGGGGAYGGGAYGGGGGTTGSSGSGGAGTSVQTVTQVNYRFTPADITVNQGDTITVSDTTPSTPHTFTITSTNVDVSNNPMQSQDVVIDLQPGTYDFFCRFHKKLGMTGTLTVT